MIAYLAIYHKYNFEYLTIQPVHSITITYLLTPPFSFPIPHSKVKKYSTSVCLLICEFAFKFHKAWLNILFEYVVGVDYIAIKLIINLFYFRNSNWILCWSLTTQWPRFHWTICCQINSTTSRHWQENLE